MARHLLNAILKLSTNNEGGYSNHPRDPGGPTNHGITIGTLSAYRGRTVSIAEVKALGLAEANAIYEANYWRPIMGDRLPAGLDYAMFDFGINSGPSRAVKELQAILRTKDKSVGVDGVMGPKTLGAIETWDTADLIRRLCNARIAFCKKLKTWKDFGRGWSYRVLGVDPSGKFKSKPGVVGDSLKMVEQKPVTFIPMPDDIIDLFQGKARDNDIKILAPLGNKLQTGAIVSTVVAGASKVVAGNVSDYLDPAKAALSFVQEYQGVISGLGWLATGLVIAIAGMTMLKTIKESRESGGLA